VTRMSRPRTSCAHRRPTCCEGADHQPTEKMNRRYLIFVAAVLASALLAGCGTATPATRAAATSPRHRGQPVVDPIPGWESAGEMSIPRYDFTATLLRDGDVLVAGGGSARGIVRDAELYNPASNSWSPAAPMLHARAGQTATLLANGDVLVAGGASTPQTELYDPTENTWRSAGAMLAPRAGGNAVRLPDGDVLLAGGSGPSGDTPPPELYIASRNSWTSAGSEPSPLRSGGTALLPNGEVLTVGGYNYNLSGDAQYSAVPTAEIYAPATKSWRLAASMSMGRAAQITAGLPDGDVLVAGGATGGYPIALVRSAEVYDPSSDSWTSVGSMSIFRGQATSVALPSGKILVVGGYNAVEENGNPAAPPLASAEIYNPGTRSWSLTLDMSTGRALADAVRMENGKILVIGGIGGSAAKPVALQSAEIYGR
jgi:N-acetylneuraminic acid mutarotase